VGRVVIQINELKDITVVESLICKEVTIRIIEKDGSFHGARSEIKIPAKSYELLEQAVVEKWLENKKSLITE
jgi:hypothetical protein